MIHEVCRLSPPLLIDSERSVCPLQRKYGSSKSYEKSFDDYSDSLELSIKAEHLLRSHACFECGKSFATSSGLKQHQHIHRSIKPFQCEVCLKAYTQFSNLCRHKRMHADCRQLIKCGECGLAFSTTTSLSKHKRFCERSKPSLKNCFVYPENLLLSVPNYLFSKYPILPRPLTSEPQYDLCSTFTHPFSRFLINMIRPDVTRSKHMESFYNDKTYREESESSPVVRKKHLIEDILKDKLDKKDLSDNFVLDDTSEIDRNVLTLKNKLYFRKDEEQSEQSKTSQQHLREKHFDGKIVNENLKCRNAYEPLDLSRNKLRSFFGFKSDDTPRLANGSSSDTCLSNKIVHYSSLLYNRAVPDSHFMNIYQTEIFCNASICNSEKISHQSREPQPGKILKPQRSYKFNSPSQSNQSSFNRQLISKIHINSVKSKDRYSCRYCGKNFPRSANLTRHLRTHTGEQPYKCKYCERSFSISSNLQRHVRNIHNKEKPFRCPLCEKCFGQQTNLDRHLKKHDVDSNRSFDNFHLPPTQAGRFDWADHENSA